MISISASFDFVDGEIIKATGGLLGSLGAPETDDIFSNAWLRNETL